jgi:phosphoserine phosphatase
MSITAPWRLACFDLDGTLVRGTSVSQHLADRMELGEEMAELERRYAAGEISNSLVAVEQARGWSHLRVAELTAMLSDIPCIDAIDATLAELRSRGIDSILATVTWSFAAEEFGRRHGFLEVSGTEIELAHGRPTGAVARHFDERDKLAFVSSYCDRHGIDLAECIAVGDSRSDVPLFGAVGFAVALNATSDARAAATVSIDTGWLPDVLDLVPWGSHTDAPSGSG